MSEFVDCRTCKSDCVRADGNYGYTFCDKYTHPPMTNADRIRAMPDKELAKFLYDFFWGRKEQVRIFNLEKWLQMTSEEEEHDRRTEIKH